MFIIGCCILVVLFFGAACIATYDGAYPRAVACTGLGALCTSVLALTINVIARRSPR
ncbi:hypothetical protein [Streptantibioticus ferralitis]|uniref:Uncharacterized protein n=1 Tax=Streptantibioticus ferralitis TaxID=236510 RepID=A0ABT5YUN1_9ACTN|nr:hypothetical protein [Streptantibioticus ferralitis]MDF2254520.1 hypothetical protein [Streptantibioticus ferralitis]